MNKYLEHKRHPLRFCVRAAAIDSATLTGSEISGKWKKIQPRVISVSTERRLARFANWASTPEKILRFTKTYGPVTLPVLGRGRRFSFSVESWQRAQEDFRTLWREQMGRPGDACRLLGQEGSLKTEEGEELSLTFGHWSYVTSTVQRLFLLELLATPDQRLRLCPGQGCKTRFFIANHGRDRYCSDRCRSWAQRFAKAKWAREKGAPARRRRVTQAKRGRAKR